MFFMSTKQPEVKLEFESTLALEAFSDAIKFLRVKENQLTSQFDNAKNEVEAEACLKELELVKHSCIVIKAARAGAISTHSFAGLDNIDEISFAIVTVVSILSILPPAFKQVFEVLQISTEVLYERYSEIYRKLEHDRTAVMKSLHFLEKLQPVEES
jgi:hypothetical protein